MRKLFLTGLTAATLLAAPVAVPTAGAMTVPAPAGFAAALRGDRLLQDAAYVCWRAWRCGPYGWCGWRRVCGWRPGPYYYYGPYRPYYYPYWRWRWHHHHWW